MRVLSLRRAGASPVACLGLLAAAVALLSRPAAAQPCEAGWLAGDLSNTIDPEGFTKAQSFAAHPSGDMIIAGQFRPRGDWPHQGIVRYNPVTNTFVQMGSGTAGAFDIAVLPDGDVASWEAPVGISGIPGIARYDFESGAWSSMGSARPSSIVKMEAAPDGSLLVSGTFTSIGSLAVSGISRLDTNSGQWSVLGDGLNGSVLAFAITSDGVIYASGGFTRSGLMPLVGVAMFDPVSNAWAQLPGGPGSFSQIEVGPDDELYGLRSMATRTGAFRYDREAQTWTELGLGSVPPVSVSVIAVRPDGALVGVTSSGVCRLNPDTDTWERLGTWAFGGGICIGVSADNDVFVGGHLRLADPAFGTPEGILRYQEQIGEWTHIGRGLDDRVTELVAAPEGTVWIGGRFRTVDGEPAGRVARFDPALRKISPVYPSPFVVVDTLLTNQQFGLIGGTQIAPPYPGGSNRRAWSFDEAAESWLGLGSIGPWIPYPIHGVHDILTLPGGDLLALGAGTYPNLFRLNSQTGRWSVVGAGNLTVGLNLPNGAVVVAGRTISLFDPATNQLSDLSPSSDLLVRSLSVLPDGDLLVGGRFFRVGEVAVQHLARYNFSTQSWSDFGGGVTSTLWSEVHATKVTSGGRVLVAGEFQRAGPLNNSISANNIAEFDPSANTWRSFGSGLERGVAYALHPMPDGGFIAGGGFIRAGGLTSPFLARYATTNPPAILQQPQPALLCSGGEITMSFGVGSTREAAFRWQWQPPASSEWLDLLDGDNLVGDVPVLATSGVNRRTISASALEGLPAESPIQLRCIATTPCGEVTSTAASLTLRAPCACYDFNRDLEVDLADAHDMAAVFTGLRLSEPGWLDGDLNNDENADLTDAQLLAAYVVSGTCGV